MITDIDVLLHKQLDDITEADARRAVDEAAALAGVLAAADEVAAAASRVFGGDIRITPSVTRASFGGILPTAQAVVGADVLSGGVEFVAAHVSAPGTVDRRRETLFSLRLRCGKWSALDAVNELYDDAVSAARGVFTRPASAERIARQLRALKG